MSTAHPEAPPTAVPGCENIEVRVNDLRQMFNAIDPSPFHDRDLDPDASEFILNWAGQIPASTPLCLTVILGRPGSAANETDLLREAVQHHFRRKGDATRLRLHQLFERGRVSLAIGLVILGCSSALGSMIHGGAMSGGVGSFLRESLIIGGWVAMWRPMEVFLYDWWPIRAEARRYDRLATMTVQIRYEGVPQ
jgi:hypothetical protein